MKKKVLAIVGTLIVAVVLMSLAACPATTNGYTPPSDGGSSQPTQGAKGADGRDGSDGRDGADGADGLSVADAYINDNGHLIVVLSNGQNIDAGYVAGGAGECVGIEDADINRYGRLILELTDGSTIDCGWVLGATGAKGDKGNKGDTGDTGATGDDGDDGIPMEYVMLTEKNSSTWQPVSGGAHGLFSFSPIGDVFTYALDATGLEADTDYSLIYYADFVDKFNQWGGNNPGAVIAVGVSDGVGDLFISGSIDLGMDLPCPPDANINTHNYCSSPDNYTHCYGAKIWLVPTDCLTDGALPVVVWSPSRFLFETDLIIYIDTDDGL